MNDTEVRRFVRKRPSKRVTVHKFHTDEQCDGLKPMTYEDETRDEIIKVSERECELLGLSECTQCETARTGGPAVSTIADFISKLKLGDTEFVALPHESLTRIARNLVAVLGTHGFYIAKRGR